MDGRDCYLFDLNGVLALPGALAGPTVAAINGLMDERIERDVLPDATTHRFADVLDWGPVVRALIDHEPILPYLEEFLGPGFRLDHDYADLIRSGQGTHRHAAARRCGAVRPRADVHVRRGPTALRVARRRLQPARRRPGRRRVRLPAGQS
jgi:hypothetical protein